MLPECVSQLDTIARDPGNEVLDGNCYQSPLRPVLSEGFHFLDAGLELMVITTVR